MLRGGGRLEFILALPGLRYSDFVGPFHAGCSSRRVKLFAA